MENRLRIILFVVLLLFILIVIHSIKKDNISLKYSLIWLLSAFVMMIIILVPDFLESMCHFLGFGLISNMIFMIAIIILLLMSFIFTMIVTKQSQKIRLLVQEVSLMKSRVEELEMKKK